MQKPHCDQTWVKVGVFGREHSFAWILIKLGIENNIIWAQWITKPILNQIQEPTPSSKYPLNLPDWQCHGYFKGSGGSWFGSQVKYMTWMHHLCPRLSPKKYRDYKTIYSTSRIPLFEHVTKTKNIYIWLLLLLFYYYHYNDFERLKLNFFSTQVQDQLIQGGYNLSPLTLWYLQTNVNCKTLLAICNCL